MSFCNTRIELQCLLGCGPDFFRGVAQAEATPDVPFAVRASEAGVGQRVSWVNLDGFVEVLYCSIELRAIALVGIETAKQVGVVRRGVHGPGRGKTRLFLRRKPDADFARDGAGQLV